HARTAIDAARRAHHRQLGRRRVDLLAIAPPPAVTARKRLEILLQQLLARALRQRDVVGRGIAAFQQDRRARRQLVSQSDTARAELEAGREKKRRNHRRESLLTCSGDAARDWLRQSLVRKTHEDTKCTP